MTGLCKVCKDPHHELNECDQTYQWTDPVRCGTPGESSLCCPSMPYPQNILKDWVFIVIHIILFSSTSILGEYGIELTFSEPLNIEKGEIYFKIAFGLVILFNIVFLIMMIRQMNHLKKNKRNYDYICGREEKNCCQTVYIIWNCILIGISMINISLTVLYFGIREDMTETGYTNLIIWSNIIGFFMLGFHLIQRIKFYKNDNLEQVKVMKNDGLPSYYDEYPNTSRSYSFSE